MAYRYATVVQLTEDDPHNDVPAGKVRLVAGRHENGYSYCVVGEHDFVDVECRTVEVIGPAYYPMGKDEIVSWAADRGRAKVAAERAVARGAE